MKLPPFERILREEDFANNTVETYSTFWRDMGHWTGLDYRPISRS